MKAAKRLPNEPNTPRITKTTLKHSWCLVHRRKSQPAFPVREGPSCLRPMRAHVGIKGEHGRGLDWELMRNHTVNPS